MAETNVLIKQGLLEASFNTDTTRAKRGNLFGGNNLCYFSTFHALLLLLRLK